MKTQLLESLESRQLYAVDLAAFAVTKPASIVKGASITLDLTFENKGDTTVSNPTFTLYLSSDSTLDSGDTMLVTGTAKAKIAAGKKVTVKKAVTFNAPSTAGDFNLLFQATTSGDTDTSNDVVATAFVISDGPKPDLSLSNAATKGIANFTVGDKKAKNGSASFSISNIGDATDKKNTSPVTVEVVLVSSAGEQVLKSYKYKTSVFASSKASKVNFPFSPKTVTAAGDYTLVARVNPALTNDQSSANDTLMLASFTASAGGTDNPGGNSEFPFGTTFIPNTITFRDDTGNIIPGEAGPWFLPGNNDVKGRWDILPVVAAQGHNFDITASADPATTIYGLLKANGKKVGRDDVFAGRTVQFGVAKAGSDGSIKLLASNTTIYFKFV